MKIEHPTKYFDMMQGTFGPGVLMLRCIKHVARNLRNNMTKAKNIRGFAANERAALQKTHGHLGIDWVIT